MATFYPLRIITRDPRNNNKEITFKFYVNPTKMSVQKKSQISEARTMAGTVFQIWPDLPDEITFSGISYGYRSIAELKGLRSTIELDPSMKECVINYKSRRYPGYIQSMEISADAENPRVYTYTFSFTSKTRFDIDRMPLGQTPGIKVEFDFFASQLRQSSEEIMNMPNDVSNNASSVFLQMTGQSGASSQGLNMFIGRVR